MQAMKKSVARSVAAAKLLTKVGTIVEVVKDSGPTTFTWTESEPWALGHGQMVVKLAGIPGGGYDCARVSPIDADHAVWTRIEFEDLGQDLTAIYVGDGVIQ